MSAPARVAPVEAPRLPTLRRTAGAVAVAAVSWMLLGTTSSPAAASTSHQPARVAAAAQADTIEVPTTPLEVAAVGFARAFASASADGLGSLMAQSGIRLQIEGSGSGGLSPRQAVASLMELARRYGAGRAVVNRAEPLNGSPDRGFAEVFWSARAAGTSDPVGIALFIGLAREGEQWRVDEVRTLP